MGKLTTELILKDSFSDKLNKINKSVQQTVALMNKMGVIGTKGVQSQINAQQRLILSEQQTIRAKERTVQAGRKIALQTQKNVGLATQHAIATQRQEAAAYRAMAAEQKTTQAKLRVTHLSQQGYIARQRENVEIARGLAAEARRAEIEARRTMNAEKHTQALERQNMAIQRQNTEHRTLMGHISEWAYKLRNIAMVYYAIRTAAQGVGAAVGLSDKMTMAEARLGLMADKDNPVSDIEAKAFGAAQRSTTDYLQFTKAVSKMGILAGDKFADQDSVIRFTELMNKQFQVGGAELSERNAAMLQLTQAIASNRLGGDELRTIRETAPLLVKYIQKSLNVGEAEFKKLAKEGEITADVIIKAMAESSAELEKMYANLPLTWERVWTRMKNVGVIAFKPIQEQLKRLFNNQTFLAFMSKITDAMIVLGNVGGWALKTIFDALGLVKSLFDRFPILLDLIKGAFIIMGAIAVGTLAKWAWGLLTNLILLPIVNFQTNLLAMNMARVAMGLQMYTGAQYAANSAMAIFQALCGNVFVIVMLVIAAIYAIVWAINKVTGSTISATGIIVGVITTAIAIIWNTFLALGEFIWIGIQRVWNNVAMFANFIANVFDNPISSIIYSWRDMGMQILNIIGSIASAIDAVFGSHLADSVNSWKSGLNSLATKAVAKYAPEENYEKKVASLDKSLQDTLGISRINYSTAWNTGYSWGQGVDTKIANMGKLNLDIEKTKLEALKGIAGNTADTADAANKGAKAGEQTAKNTAHQEDYSYLRDWSYQRGLGSSIGYNIKIEQNNRNNIASSLDVSSIVNAVLDGIVDGLNNNAERGFAR